MPHYRWQGITWDGTIRKGTTFAQSDNALEALLLQQEIGIIKCWQTKKWFGRTNVNLAQKLDFLKHLSTLINAGIHIPQALTIITAQVKQKDLLEILYDIMFDVQSGVTLSTSMQKHPRCFDAVTIGIIHAGQESGKLGLALNGLCQYQEHIYTIHKKLRAASITPLITLLFFIIITAIICFMIVPSFAQIFATSKQPIPAATQTLIGLCTFLKTNGLALASSLFAILALSGMGIRKTAQGRLICHWLALRIPLIKNIIICHTITTFARSTSLLLDGGMQMVPALTLTKESIRNQYLYNTVTLLAQTVEQGQSLSNAMQSGATPLFDADLIALVTVGEESGTLPLMLGKAGDIYQQKMVNNLTLVSSLFQPLLIIILGLLVAFLIFIVYLPVFNLAHIVP